ncbi:hypothetical protein BGX33_011341 [Mortierella sp. NVP41]|nr:hypothetical protein BGX33_011341 [Mortierella sp. NVP41]
MAGVRGSKSLCCSGLEVDMKGMFAVTARILAKRRSSKAVPIMLRTWTNLKTFSAPGLQLLHGYILPDSSIGWTCLGLERLEFSLVSLEERSKADRENVSRWIYKSGAVTTLQILSLNCPGLNKSDMVHLGGVTSLNRLILGESPSLGQWSLQQVAPLLQIYPLLSYLDLQIPLRWQRRIGFWLRDHYLKIEFDDPTMFIED